MIVINTNIQEDVIGQCALDITVVLCVIKTCLDLFQTKENPTFKDNDFTKDNAKLCIGDDVKKDLLQRVRDDVEVSMLVRNKAVDIMIQLKNKCSGT